MYCDRGLENASRGRRPRAAFSSRRSQFFTIWTGLLSRQITCLLFFPAVHWLSLQITIGFVYAALESCHSMGLRAVYQRFVKNLGNERVTKIVEKRKMYLF